jgi:hypothetical protein
METPKVVAQPSFGVDRGAAYDWTVNVAVSATFTLIGCTFDPKTQWRQEFI